MCVCFRIFPYVSSTKSFEEPTLDSAFKRLHRQSGRGVGDTRWRSWFRHCDTSRKVAGSIPDGVPGLFHWHNPSGRLVAVESTQPLTEMSTWNISWGQRRPGRESVNLPPPCADCLENWEPQSAGTVRACNKPVMGLLYILNRVASLCNHSYTGRNSMAVLRYIPMWKWPEST